MLSGEFVMTVAALTARQDEGMFFSAAVSQIQTFPPKDAGPRGLHRP